MADERYNPEHLKSSGFRMDFDGASGDGHGGSKHPCVNG